MPVSLTWLAFAERATMESLISEDLTLNLQVVDGVQVDVEGPKEVLRAIKKRFFKSNNAKVQLLTLSVRMID